MPDQESDLRPLFESKLIDSIPDVLCIADANGVFRFVNHACERRLGYLPEEIIGKSYTEFVFQEDLENTRVTFEFVTTGVEISNFFNRYVGKDGSLIHLSWSARWDDREKLIYATARVSTELPRVKLLQTQYEQKLKEHNRRLSGILERITEGFIALDKEGRVIYWNKAAERISGRSREEVLSRNIWDCYPEFANTEFFKGYHNALHYNSSRHYEAYYHSTDVWVEISVFPSDNGLTCFFRDITEKKKMEEHLKNQARENQKRLTAAVIKAQEKERAQVGLELHDNVNQVLTTVKLYTELCMGESSPELMSRSRDLLQSCIDEIRGLSRRLSAPSLGKIRMRDSIKELVEAIAATGKTIISLDTDGIRDLGVDEEMHLAIYRILQEHLTNILKHSGASEVKIIIDYLDEDLIIKVIDNGKGFNMEEKRNGIGISNMVSRAESLGGRLTINSAPGLGCVLIAIFSMAGEAEVTDSRKPVVLKNAG